MAADGRPVELQYRRAGSAAGETKLHAVVALNAVALGPPFALGAAVLATGLDSNTTGWALRINLFGGLVGPQSSIIAFLVAGSGYRRTREEGLPATKYVWLQALALVAFLSSCIGGLIVGWVARGFR